MLLLVRMEKVTASGNLAPSRFVAYSMAVIVCVCVRVLVLVSLGLEEFCQSLSGAALRCLDHSRIILTTNIDDDNDLDKYFCCKEHDTLLKFS